MYHTLTSKKGNCHVNPDRLAERGVKSVKCRKFSILIFKLHYQSQSLLFVIEHYLSMLSGCFVGQIVHGNPR